MIFIFIFTANFKASIKNLPFNKLYTKCAWNGRTIVMIIITLWKDTNFVLNIRGSKSWEIKHFNNKIMKWQVCCIYCVHSVQVYSYRMGKLHVQRIYYLSKSNKSKHHSVNMQQLFHCIIILPAIMCPVKLIWQNCKHSYRPAITKTMVPNNLQKPYQTSPTEQLQHWQILCSTTIHYKNFLCQFGHVRNLKQKCTWKQYCNKLKAITFASIWKSFRTMNYCHQTWLHHAFNT